MAGPTATIRRVPTFPVRVEGPPGAFPLPAGKLRFQMAVGDLPAGFSVYRPIGEVALGPAGHLYMSFPTLDLVVRFTRPRLDLAYFGSAKYGGKDELVVHPGAITFEGERILVANDRQGQVTVFDAAFNMLELVQMKTRDPLPGPESQCLVFSEEKPRHFFRADHRNRIRQLYEVPLDEDRDPRGQALVFHIQPDWEIVAARRDGSRVIHLKTSGPRLRQFLIDFSAVFGEAANTWGQGLEVHAVRWARERYWLLLTAPWRGETASLMLLLDAEGRIDGWYRLPFAADGFDLDATTMVLFNRDAGSAATYRLTGF